MTGQRQNVVARKTLRGWESKLFMTVSEAAAELDVDTRTVHRAIEAGQITAIRISEKTVRIPVATFLAEVAHIAPDGTDGESPAQASPSNVHALTRAGDENHGDPRAS